MSRKLAVTIALLALFSNAWARETYPEELSYLTFENERKIRLTAPLDTDQTYILEKRALVHTPWGGKPQKLFTLPGHMAMEANILLNISKSFPVLEDPDSVDGLPSREIHLLHGSDEFVEARTILEAVKQKLIGYIRKRYNCKKCLICTGLLRQYSTNAGERRKHPIHYDSQAFVTIVITLNPKDYLGGLYVQEGDNSSTRQFFRLEHGDVILHQYGLRHGVEVVAGKRHSAIFWVTDSMESCTNKLTPWFVGDAQKGNPIAQYNLARMYSKGRGGVEKDVNAAMKWYAKSSLQGFPSAQFQFARLLMAQGDANHTMAMHVLQKAALSGNGDAQDFLGGLLENGETVARNITAAVAWYQSAAEQGHPSGMFNYGRHILLGSNGLNDDRAGVRWIRLSEEAGVKAATRMLQDIPKDLKTDL